MQNRHQRQAPVADFSKDEELSAYRLMLTIRRFEERPGRCTAWG